MLVLGGTVGAEAQDAGDSVDLPALQVETKTAKPKKKIKTAKPKPQKKAPQPVVAQPMPVAEPVALPADGLSSNLTPSSGNTLDAGSGMARRPGSVQDTPQVVNVIPQEILKEKNTQTLEQALRSVPGVTLAIGEGGPPNGDQFRIRGVQSKGDIYVDGLRDFGMYTRDSFNFESIQVLKGPSSETFGMGTGGGAINTQTKIARLDNFTNAEVTAGTGSLARTTIDGNYRIGETSAIRLNGMWTDMENPDRDLVESQRWGLAADAGFGIGTNTEFHLSYFHQEDDRVPDYGVPLVTIPGVTTGVSKRPVTEFGVPRDTFYGFTNDHDDTSVDAVTARLKHNFSNNLSLNSDMRYTSYDRSFLATKASGCAGTCATELLGGNPANAFVNFSGPGAYEMDGWAFQNVTSLLARFNTGMLRHELVVGFDYFKESNHRDGFASRTTATSGGLTKNLFDPTHVGGSDPYIFSSWRDGDSENFALFATDRVWLTREWSVVGGVRWDDFSAETTMATGVTSTDSSMVSPKASIIFEPNKSETYYASWSRALSPNGYYVTGESVSATDADPEETETFELGGKWSLLNDKLGLTAAIFQVDKDNAIQVDPLTGAPVATNYRERGERYRIRGVEFGVTGKLSPLWSIYAGYTYLDAEILSGSVAGSTATPANAGNQVWLVPEHSGSIWLTYDATAWLPEVFSRGRLKIASGITASSSIFLDAGNTSEVPSSFTWDGMVSYETKDWKLSFNAYNISDELNYEQLWTDRVVPSMGRHFTVTAGVKF